MEEQRDLVRSDPRQLDFHDALWTRVRIREMPQREFRVTVSERSVSSILKRLDITVQRPPLKAVEQDPELVQRWLNEEWPKIRAQAKRPARWFTLATSPTFVPMRTVARSGA